MKVQDIINHNVSSYQEFERALSNSKVNLSFFGNPVLVGQISDDCVSLSEVTKKWFSLSSRDVFYSPQECRAAISSQNKLLRYYSTSDDLKDRSYNIFVVFSRIVKKVIAPAMNLLGIPMQYLSKPSERRDLEYCPEKVSVSVLEQAKNFGFIA